MSALQWIANLSWAVWMLCWWLERRVHRQTRNLLAASIVVRMQSAGVRMVVTKAPKGMTIDKAQAEVDGIMKTVLGVMP